MNTQHQAIILIDLAFGDAGKGTLVDFLARKHAAHTVVRFNGGPQAGHNVVTPDGRHHTFSQFGSGAFVPGVRTLLSRFMLIEPYALLNEAAHLASVGVKGALDRLYIDRRAPVITPAHQAANRLREIARGTAAHGTCGMGVGETMQDLLDRPDLMLQAGDLADAATVKRKLHEIVAYKTERLKDVISAAHGRPNANGPLATLLNPTWIDAASETYAAVAHHAHIIDPPATRALLRENGTTLFEAAQGILLDEWFGFHPHTTWSTTTFQNAVTLLDESAHEGPRTKIAALRTYFTRHGAGPFVTEDNSLRPNLPEPHNADAGWQGGFRVGPLDTVAARYALAVAGGADFLALTHLDRLPSLPPHLCTAYHLQGPAPDENLDEVFARNDKKHITAIRVNRPADLLHQERLTNLLRQCRPLYTPLPDQTPETFIRHLEHQLHTPIKLLSSGPNADHKRLL